MPNKILISVVIPTYNCSNGILPLLDSLKSQSIQKSSYEILVIDNNSNDDTKEIVQDFIDNHNLQVNYYFEPHPGSHNARNKGILESKGEIICFFDDDAEVSSNHLKLVYDEFAINKNIGVVGGRIYPKWEKEPSDWVYDYGTRKVHGVFAYLDYGDERQVLKKDFLWCCNLCIKRELLMELNGFPYEGFPAKYKQYTGHGEIELIKKVRGLGFEIIYNPKAFVFHRVNKRRITLDYFIERYERWGIEKTNWVFKSNKTKFKATLKLLKSIKKILLNLNAEAKHKIEPKYFKTIEKTRALSIFTQTLRVLFSPSLHSYIKNNNYFDEITHTGNSG